MQRNGERRARVIVAVLGLAGLWTVAEALLTTTEDPTRSLLHHIGGLVLRVGGLWIGAGVFAALRGFWHRRFRRDLIWVLGGFARWTERRLPAFEARSSQGEPLKLGERIALLSGVFVLGLDVCLTTLLLRDVFPEPPYLVPALEALAPGMQEWAFYVSVASLKTALALWFGAFERTREGTSSPLRWFVLGSASAFDGALAIARGVVLAEEGIAGPSIMVSNIVFVGFGLAVPWVVAHTGRLLASSLDPWLARVSALQTLAAVPRWIGLGLLWLAVIVVLVPTGTVGLLLGFLTAVWFAVEDTAGLVLGHDPAHPPIDPALARLADIPVEDVPEPPHHHRPSNFLPRLGGVS